MEFPEESEEWFEIIRADLQEYNQDFFAVSQYANKVSSLCLQIRHTINYGTAEYLSSIFPVLVAQADAIENVIPVLTHSDNSSSTSRPGDVPIYISGACTAAPIASYIIFSSTYSITSRNFCSRNTTLHHSKKGATTAFWQSEPWLKK
jgi:hypothetical protein